MDDSFLVIEGGVARKVILDLMVPRERAPEVHNFYSSHTPTERDQLAR